jgi:hypothetical protein
MFAASVSATLSKCSPVVDMNRTVDVVRPALGSCAVQLRLGVRIDSAYVAAEGSEAGDMVAGRIAAS